MEDKVNHPSHYETDGIQCIDAMIAAQGKEAVKEFCVCNAFKYVWRFRHKNGLEDLKKARWYLDKRIELEGDQERKTWNDSLEPDVFTCGKCGVSIDVVLLNGDDGFTPTYCPSCGRAVCDTNPTWGTWKGHADKVWKLIQEEGDGNVDD